MRTSLDGSLPSTARAVLENPSTLDGFQLEPFAEPNA
jgi:hypothetical protein